MAESKTKSWKCHTCGQTFDGRSGLMKHIRAEHPGPRKAKRSSGAWQYCPFDGTAFKEAWAFCPTCRCERRTL